MTLTKKQEEHLRGVIGIAQAVYKSGRTTGLDRWRSLEDSARLLLVLSDIEE